MCIWYSLFTVYKSVLIYIFSQNITVILIFYNIFLNTAITSKNTKMTKALSICLNLPGGGGDGFIKQVTFELFFQVGKGGSAFQKKETVIFKSQIYMRAWCTLKICMYVERSYMTQIQKVVKVCV